MTATTGKNLYLAFGSTVLDTDYRSFSGSEEMGTVDASAGSDTARTYLTTLEDGTASATVVRQSGTVGTVIATALAVGTAGTLTWAEEGTTAGKPRSTAWAIVTGLENSMEYADLVVMDIEWQFSSDVTHSTY